MSSGRLICPIGEPAINANFTAGVGSTWTTYLTGTTTLATMYSDSGLTTTIANPQTANSAGRFEAQCTVFWVDATQAYDVLIGFTDGSSMLFQEIYALGAQTNVTGYAPLNSPTFTGNPQAPTPSLADNSNSLATTAFVKGQNYAPLASPTFSGTPTAPTASPGTNTTQLATTAFVEAAVGGTTSFGSNGYVKEGSGYVRQWGWYNSSVTDFTTIPISFNITFPNACYGATATIINPSSTDYNVPTGVQVKQGTLTTTGVTFVIVGYESGTPDPASGLYWEAWGH